MARNGIDPVTGKQNFSLGKRQSSQLPTNMLLQVYPPTPEPSLAYEGLLQEVLSHSANLRGPVLNIV